MVLSKDARISFRETTGLPDVCCMYVRRIVPALPSGLTRLSIVDPIDRYSILLVPKQSLDLHFSHTETSERNGLTMAASVSLIMRACSNSSPTRRTSAQRKFHLHQASLEQLTNMINRMIEVSNVLKECLIIISQYSCLQHVDPHTLQSFPSSCCFEERSTARMRPQCCD